MVKRLGVLVLSLSTAIATAQNAPSAKFAFHPGDTVRLLVSFEQPPAKDARLSLSYHLLDYPPDQKADFMLGFTLSGSDKINDHTIEVNGQVADNMASGDYKISALSLSRPGFFDGSVGENQLQGAPVLTVINPKKDPKRVDVPAVKSITVAPK